MAYNVNSSAQPSQYLNLLVNSKSNTNNNTNTNPDPKSQLNSAFNLNFTPTSPHPSSHSPAAEPTSSPPHSSTHAVPNRHSKQRKHQPLILRRDNPHGIYRDRVEAWNRFCEMEGGDVGCERDGGDGESERDEEGSREDRRWIEAWRRIEEWIDDVQQELGGCPMRNEEGRERRTRGDDKEIDSGK